MITKTQAQFGMVVAGCYEGTPSRNSFRYGATARDGQLYEWSWGHKGVVTSWNRLVIQDARRTTYACGLYTACSTRWFSAASQITGINNNTKPCHISSKPELCSQYRICVIFYNLLTDSSSGCTFSFSCHLFSDCPMVRGYWLLATTSSTNNRTSTNEHTINYDQDPYPRVFDVPRR